MRLSVATYNKDTLLIIFFNRDIRTPLFFLGPKSVHIRVHRTWLLIESCIITAGLRIGGGTGSTVKIIHSGLQNSGFNPKTAQSSLEIHWNISRTCLAVTAIPCLSESNHSAVSSKPDLWILGCKRPHPLDI